MTSFIADDQCLLPEWGVKAELQSASAKLWLVITHALHGRAGDPEPVLQAFTGLQ